MADEVDYQYVEVQPYAAETVIAEAEDRRVPLAGAILIAAILGGGR